MSNTAVAGWYPDPEMAGTQRYWDGSAWTEHVAPLSPPTHEDSTPRSASFATGGQNAQSEGDGLTLPGQAEQPAAVERFDQRLPPPGTQWLTKWSGRKYKTKKTVLNAACQACGKRYQLTGGTLNAYADQASGWAAFGRVVDGLDLWANNDPNGNAAKQLKYNRERAELQGKREAELRAKLACLCPGCRSDQVLVEAPK